MEQRAGMHRIDVVVAGCGNDGRLQPVALSSSISPEPPLIALDPFHENVSPDRFDRAAVSHHAFPGSGRHAPGAGSRILGIQPSLCRLDDEGIL